MSTYEISKSSLLSLKAEIHRKQQELVKAKTDNEVKINLIKKNTPLEIKNKGIEARQKNDITEEEENLLKQSKSILDAKSKLYDKLSLGKITQKESEQTSRFLVQFDKKRKSSVHDCQLSDDDEPDVNKYPESDEDYYKSDDDELDDPDNKWIDYVDSFGRTRRCMQKDFAYLKSKDKELKLICGIAEEGKNNSTHSDDNKGNEEKKSSEESELLSSDMRREILRLQWEKEEAELRNKSNIHYQDILFNEARTHGVGYYGFSKDEEERAKQQEALKKLREETEQKQKRAQDLKAMREKQLATRIKAATNRKRARMGLPPIEDDPEPQQKPDTAEEALLIDVVRNELKQKEEEILEKARKNHVRPWDVGKDGVKEHYEMSQEEWVSHKRDERPVEFAPPTSYRKEFRSQVKNINLEEPDKSLKFTTKKSKKRRTIQNQIQGKFIFDNKIQDHDMNNRNNSLNSNLSGVSHFEGMDRSISPHFNNETVFEEIHQNPPVEPTEILNLCQATDFDDRLLPNYLKTMENQRNEAMDGISYSDNSNSDNESSRGKGVEIAPPPTIDYYGPSSSKKPRNVPSNDNIQDSIEAGLRFLRKQVEQKEKSTKHPREMYLS